jgi:hypothetical protein
LRVSWPANHPVRAKSHSKGDLRLARGTERLSIHPPLILLLISPFGLFPILIFIFSGGIVFPEGSSLTRIIHEGSSRNHGVARRDRRAESARQLQSRAYDWREQLKTVC